MRIIDFIVDYLRDNPEKYHSVEQIANGLNFDKSSVGNALYYSVNRPGVKNKYPIAKVTSQGMNQYRYKAKRTKPVDHVGYEPKLHSNLQPDPLWIDKFLSTKQPQEPVNPYEGILDSISTLIADNHNMRDALISIRNTINEVLEK